MQWDQVIEPIEERSEIEGDEKRRVLEAVQYLRSELFEGQDPDLSSHPLVSRLTNFAPWNLRWVLWFTSTLQELQSHHGYEGLKSRLQRADEAREAMTIVDIASEFLSGGYEITIDPDLDDFDKVPDLLVRNESADRPFVVEVKEFQEHREEKKSRETIWGLSKAVHEGTEAVGSLKHSGRIEKSLAEPHLDEIKEKVRKLAEDANREGRLQALEISNTLSFAVAPEHDEESLEEWAQKRGLGVNQIRGPAPRVDRLKMIGKHLNWKQDQIPKEHPGIVVMVGSQIFWRYRMQAAVSMLEEEIYQHPKTVLTVLKGSNPAAGVLTDERSEYLEKRVGRHRVIERRRLELLFEQFLILHNRFHDHEKIEEEVREVMDVFGKQGAKDSSRIRD